MAAPDQRDELLWAAIESGRLADDLAADTEIAARFAAHQKLETLFELLRQPADVIAADTGPPDHPARIGRYQVCRVLGRGAFGTVYLADDPELDRPVAIKVPRRERFASQQDVERFLEEARCAARLKHPGIVTMHDVGHEGDLCYIVMEYVQGRSLEELMRSQRPSPAEAAGLIARVADALHYAHKKGFVHRDLKPGNILIDDQGHPHITDFGLAVSEDSQRLQAGQVAGTPAYMSPEQVRGETHRLDGRTDIWSLGVILYELFTGRQPFWRGNVAECLDEILNREPKPPRQVEDTIPPELERIVLKCLAKPVNERYSTAADLAADLRHWRPTLREGPVADHGQFKATHRRSRLWITIAAAAIVLLVVIGVILNRNLLRNTEGTGPLTGAVTVRVWEPGNINRHGLSLNEAGALPLRGGDEIRVEATVGRPSYLYVIWITSDGAVTPVYPWSPGRWDQRPSQEEPVSLVSLPEGLDTRWPMKGPPGMETLILLARDTPLPEDIDLQNLFSDFPTQQVQDSQALVELDTGLITRHTDRGPQFLHPSRSDDQVAKAQRFLVEKIQPHFQCVRAISFPSLASGEE